LRIFSDNNQALEEWVLLRSLERNPGPRLVPAAAAAARTAVQAHLRASELRPNFPSLRPRGVSVNFSPKMHPSISLFALMAAMAEPPTPRNFDYLKALMNIQYQGVKKSEANVSRLNFRPSPRYWA
jgi:hypothetical protein